MLAGTAAAGGCSSSPGARPAPPASASPSPSGPGGAHAPVPAGPAAPGPPASGACTQAGVIDSWPVARRAAALVVVPVLDASPAAVRVAVAAGAGGVLLLGTVPPGPQLAAALAPARAAPIPLLTMADQEGGAVQRMAPDVTSMPWPRQMAATMTTAQVEHLAEVVGRQMAALGVVVDLAPVLDLDSGPALTAQDPDGPRSFSPDPAVAARYGQAFAAGLRAGGVLAVVKHFPGLGGSSGNSDFGPAHTRPLSQLGAAGLLPFEQAVASGVPAVMVTVAAVPGAGEDGGGASPASLPAALSAPVVSGLLRGRLRFGGLVVTDSLSAGAVRAAGFTPATAAVAAVRAGADMVLFGSTLNAADRAALAPGPLEGQTADVVGALVSAVQDGSLPPSRLDAAVGHVLTAGGIDLCRPGKG